MAYIVEFANPVKNPITVNDNTVDSTTAMALLGKNYEGYGNIVAQNFLTLLENSSSATAPLNPIQGQTWFDESTNALNVYSGNEWKRQAYIHVSDNAPSSGAVDGDLWQDDDGIVYVRYANVWYKLGGPKYTTYREDGTMEDSTGGVHNVTKHVVGDTLIMIVSNDGPFTPTADEILPDGVTLLNTVFPVINKGVNMNPNTSDGFIMVLNDTITSTSTTIGATANSVRVAYETATTNGNNAAAQALADAVTAFNAFGLGATTSVNVTNADTLTETGIYSVSATWVGSPVAGTNGENQGYLVHLQWGNSAYRFQMFYNVNGVYKSKFRRMDNNVWQSWYDNITSYDTASESKAGIVQLNNTVTSTSTTEASTANAVKQAYDRTALAFSGASGQPKIERSAFAPSALASSPMITVYPLQQTSTVHAVNSVNHIYPPSFANSSVAINEMNAGRAYYFMTTSGSGATQNLRGSWYYPLRQDIISFTGTTRQQYIGMVVNIQSVAITVRVSVRTYQFNNDTAEIRIRKNDVVQSTQAVNGGTYSQNNFDIAVSGGEVAYFSVEGRISGGNGTDFLILRDYWLVLV